MAMRGSYVTTTHIAMCECGWKRLVDFDAEEMEAHIDSHVRSFDRDQRWKHDITVDSIERTFYHWQSEE